MSKSEQPVQFLGVVGGSPAVITETIYALCVMPEAEEAETIGGVHVITTTHGRDKLEACLKGQLRRMAEDYPEAAGRIPCPDEVPIEIEVPEDYRSGEPLSDVRDTESSAAMADRVHRRVREFCQEGKPRVFASMAGGRKTMGYFVGHAMMCFGRAGDRLTHVLAGEHAERCPTFFYPPPEPREMETFGGQVFDASSEVVELHEIPFVRLRYAAKARVEVPESFVEVVESAQTELTGEAKLEVDLEMAQVRYAGTRFRLSPVQLAMFIVVAVEHAAGRTPIPGKMFTIQESEVRSRLVNVYYEIVDAPEDKEAFFVWGYDEEYHEAELNRANENMRQQFKQGRNWLKQNFPEFQLQKIIPDGRGGGYSLGSDPEDIEIIGRERYPDAPGE